VHVQDFEFDIAKQSGLNSKNGLLHKILMYVEKKLLNSADIVSTISQGMKEILKQKSDSESFFLPNWIDNQKKIKFTSHRYLESKKVKVLYSGNIGEKQDWEAFLKFCKHASSKKYDIVVVGDGAKKNWLLGNIKSFSHVKYFPPVPLNELSSLLRSADIHILFQKVDVMDAVMPSKVLGMMASSRPSLIIGNDNSEIKTIFDFCCPGIFFNCYSDQVIIELGKLVENPIKMIEMGRSANDYVVTNFSKSKVLSRFLHKIDLL
jgi:colanic acid biosynthesis glycosyl transferase WcaI